MKDKTKRLDIALPLHHAYVIEGEQSSAVKEIREFLSDELGISLHGNIDFFEREYESFGIENAREIKDFMFEKAIGEYKIFLLSMPSMTTQSGNALLKALEEPPKGTHFFIIVPNSKRLLDTLMSRVVLLKLESGSDVPDEGPMTVTASEFLKMPESKRMEEVKNILGLYDKEKISKTDIISFFKRILQEYKTTKGYDPKALKNAVASFDYMSDQSSSMKILMEYISMTL